MYILELSFECYRDTSLGEAEPAIVNYLDMLRYQGQILGREFPTSMQDGHFVSRVVCPEQDSLHPDNQSEQVALAEQGLHQAGLLAPKLHLQGMDLLSDSTDPCGQTDERPSWMLLYTSFLHSCSPLRCGDHFAPIPLYRLPAIANGDHKQIIKWQEDWEACDQLQMNGSIAEHAALHEIGEVGSRLQRRGSDLAKRLEGSSGIPTYYYLYRVGGLSKAAEQARPCPGCGGNWTLEAPLHEIFDFKCDACRLVSNLSWDFKD
ncbi:MULTISPECIES: Zn-ribbon-containing protein [unclassified Aeromonas]|uniref:Zn-ribbon-containing protein n=1 Tax=unclassified Aeromonas TaxID=257493 RepID=UPI001C437065|nr:MULTISPECIES: Zn-ribbon-containing protein [unclassified Aeromonas]MBV7414651.1 Zn-ribbon-containing protein [Aeromonas sp. sif2433]MBV7435679.1 Zn-ribbon-containing protein [Aeromonas sp. sif2416]